MNFSFRCFGAFFSGISREFEFQTVKRLNNFSKSTDAVSLESVQGSGKQERTQNISIPAESQ